MVTRCLCAFSLTFCLAFAQDASAPPQPIPFSHKLHVSGVSLTCADCHVYPAKFGDSVGIPDAPKCLECHAFSVKQTSTLGTLKAWAGKNQPIPWVRVFALRDFVFFDHRFHLQNGAQCENCHGPVATEDVVADPLNATKMAFCQPCHVKAGAKTGCTTCHDAR
jgi:hypothetical protein